MIVYFQLDTERLKFIYDNEVFGFGHYCQLNQKKIKENVKNWETKMPTKVCNSYFSKREYLVLGTLYFIGDSKYIQLLIDGSKPLIFDTYVSDWLKNIAEQMHDLGSRKTVQDMFFDNPPGILQNLTVDPNNN